jgi:hypothetical protein
VYSNTVYKSAVGMPTPRWSRFSGQS